MSTWHETYEPAQTSRQFPHGSVFRHWARKPGDTRRLPDIRGVHDPLIITISNRLRSLATSPAGSRFWTVTETPTGWDVTMYRRGPLAYARNIYTLKNLTRSRAEEALTVLRARGEIIQKES